MFLEVAVLWNRMNHISVKRWIPVLTARGHSLPYCSTHLRPSPPSEPDFTSRNHTHHTKRRPYHPHHPTQPSIVFTFFRFYRFAENQLLLSTPQLSRNCLLRNSNVQWLKSKSKIENLSHHWSCELMWLLITLPPFFIWSQFSNQRPPWLAHCYDFAPDLGSVVGQDFDSDHDPIMFRQETWPCCICKLKGESTEKKSGKFSDFQNLGVFSNFSVWHHIVCHRYR